MKTIVFLFLTICLVSFGRISQSGGTQSGGLVLDITAGNLEWLRLDAANDPMQGNLDFGNFNIDNVGILEIDDGTSAPFARIFPTLSPNPFGAPGLNELTIEVESTGADFPENTAALSIVNSVPDATRDTEVKVHGKGSASLEDDSHHLAMGWLQGQSAYVIRSVSWTGTDSIPEPLIVGIGSDTANDAVKAKGSTTIRATSKVFGTGDGADIIYFAGESAGGSDGTHKFSNQAVEDVGSLDLNNGSNSVLVTPEVGSGFGDALNFDTNELIFCNSGNCRITNAGGGGIQIRSNNSNRWVFDFNGDFRNLSSGNLLLGNNDITGVGLLEINDGVNAGTISPISGGLKFNIDKFEVGDGSGVFIIDSVNSNAIEFRIGNALKWNVQNSGELQGRDTTNGGFEVVHQTSMTNPPAGRLQLYPESDDRWKQLTSAGVEETLAFLSEVEVVAGENASEDSVQTTTDGLVTIRTFTASTDFQDDDTITVKWECSATQDTGAKGAYIEGRYTFRKDGAAAPVLIDNTTLTDHEDATSIEVPVVTISGSNLLLQVEGRAAETYEWTCWSSLRLRNAS